jgi:hypothetical protein
MDPLFLIGGAGLVALLLRKKQVATPEPQPMPAPEGGGSITALLGTAGAAAGAAALAAGGYALGKSITGTEAGGIAGAVNPVIGNAVNVGTQVGKEVDKALGGSGTGATGVISQAGFGTAFGFAQVFGAAAAASAIATALPIYLVWTIVEDLNRLAYGPAGAKRDYDAQWRKAFDNAAPAMRAQFGTLDSKTLERFTTEFTDGYMMQVNRLNRLQWERKPRGIGQDETMHLVFGNDRGYFLYPHEISRRDRTSNFLTSLVPGPDQVPSPAESADFRFHRNAIIPAGRMDRFSVGNEQMGRVFANAVAYADHMRQPRGFSQSETSHAEWGRNEGKFEGSVITPNGDLEFEGFLFTWDKKAKRPVLKQAGVLSPPPPAVEPSPIKPLEAPLPQYAGLAPTIAPAPAPTALAPVAVPTLQVQTLQGTTLAQKAKLSGF